MVVVAGFSSHLARTAGAAATAIHDRSHIGFTRQSITRIVEADARASYVFNPKAFLEPPVLPKFPLPPPTLLATDA